MVAVRVVTPPVHAEAKSCSSCSRDEAQKLDELRIGGFNSNLWIVTMVKEESNRLP